LAVAVVGLISFAGHAAAADLAVMPVKAPAAATPSPAFAWSGWYVGAHVGFAAGTSPWTSSAAGAAPVGGTFGFPVTFDFFGGTGSYVAGLQGGYNYVTPSHLLFGVEVDATFPNSDVARPPSIRGSQTVASPLLGQATYSEFVFHGGTARARVGYVSDNNWLVYATGGLAWTYDQVSRTQVDNAALAAGTQDAALLWRLGWAAGAGVEVPLSPSWSITGEFLATGFPDRGALFPAAGELYRSSLMMESVRVGFNYHIGQDASAADFFTRGADALELNNFALHAQATYTQQYDPPFRAPYGGTNSLAPGIGRETFDYTIFAGMRLWQGAEAWINPEIDQGFGLSGSVGAAGFPSGEAYKVGADYPYVRLHRAFIRQTIDLGGEEQKVDSGANQFSGSQTADRVVITVGKFGVVDVFDTNKYAHDPRSDFLNWTILDTGTFDYAADAWAYTVGAAVEWYQGPWTLRGGMFDLSIAPNTTVLDPTLGQFQWDAEIERRYSIMDQPGKIAVTAFLTRGRMGSYTDALALAAATGMTPSTALVRTYTGRGGLSMNLEQQLVPNVGLFVRAGWANGQREAYEFTDVDRTAAAGLSISGKLWNRDDDTFGLAGIVNGISPEHAAYLNAGGLGILVGDGQLPHPGNEKIMEAYYSLPVYVAKLTFDYQLIANPAYNRDRGPVSVLGARVHWQY
jgi:high affinity Mn2+ porin